jgi:hypothetical protein
MAKDFSVGQVVEHAAYGVGTISATEADRITIDFETHGTKKFLTSIVKLQPSDKIPAPKARKRASRKAKATVVETKATA